MANPLKALKHRAVTFWNNLPSTTQRNPADWFVDWVRGGIESDSGLEVTAATAMTLATVWQAVSIISGDIGQVPLTLYRRTDKGREKAREHAAYRLTRRRPNRFMNAGTFKETLQSHVLLGGNGRAGIVRNGFGEPIELVPFLPDRCHEEMKGGELYHVALVGEAQQEKWYPDKDVLHLKGLGDGITGYDVITMAKNSFGLALAQEKHGNRTFKNAARPSIVLETEQAFGREAAMQTLADWERAVSGMDNAGKTALLQRGIKASPISINNDNAQWLESRAFQRQEIASWFNLPPHKLGDSQKAGYNGLEHEQFTYLATCLQRWQVMWAEECSEKLLSDSEKDGDEYYFEFDNNVLVKTDMETRWKTYQMGIVNEILSPNEVREMENMNKRDGGDEYRNPNTKVESLDAGSDSEDDNNSVKENRLRGMIRVERQRIQQAAGRSPNFLKWLDDFYARWEPRLASVLDECDAPGEASVHCAESKRQLLDVAGTATASEFPEAIKTAIRDWEDRALTLLS